eukprot:CAMPEP_0113395406 /NCGR_PEP_ID=MMETSP0013_2-20120614/13176_1 /TAXON_ID=2843 ORGANISM="Skeletonema costatum, Strain 1716" /NCGR_SAMPLE_ID=MMETSP0013_2 /ASSEMBLY_ACC=CAM_ASM_000158 /LENGTH=586 /DNA_ID=CAMNT_0000279613 /DNA_START=45 /DNA_END=1802 /DNA_ORIENTATION=- /assembly_acc=CAM_ASM_000158
MKFHSKCLIVTAAQSVAVSAKTSSSSYSSSITSSPSLTLSYKPYQSSISANNSNEVDIFTIIDIIRGGAIEVVDKTPKKKKKSSKSSKTKGTTKTNTPPPTTSSDEEDEDAKLAINTAMKDSDTAHTLGEAIRARAHILRKDKLPYAERTFDSALVSLGLSLGTAGLDVDEDDIVSVTDSGDSDEGDEDAESKATTTTTMAYYQYGHNSQQQNQQYVQPSTSAVIANYFLKTHGGTHLLQCVLSLLASVLGMACLVLPPFPSAAALVAAATASNNNNNNKVASVTSVQLSKRILNSTTKHQLLQQTLLLAMAKHVSALVGAVILGAQRIPTLGIRNARRHLESVAVDPVGQYLFYCSILVVWLGWFGGASGVEFVSGLRRSVISIQNTASAAVAGGAENAEVEAMSQLLDVLSQSSPPWFLSQSHGGAIISIIMLTPILLREVISIIWVVSDVLSLAFTTSGGITGKFCQGILSTARSILDAFMSIVISSDQWRKADSFQRQRTLARLVSQISLVLEVIVGAVLFGDAIQAFWGFSFGGGATSGAVVGTRLPLKIVVGKMACAHLYINFLLSRRRKIHALVGSIRS